MSQSNFELKHTLLKQIYLENVIDEGIQRALNLNRSELRQKRQNPEDNIVTYVSRLNTKNPELFGASLQNLNILRRSENEYFTGEYYHYIMETSPCEKHPRFAPNI